MKIYEIIGNAQQQKRAVAQPTVVKQQTRVAQLANQIVASDAQLPPTEMEKVVAMQYARNIQKQTDVNYVRRLQQQLAYAFRKR